MSTFLDIDVDSITKDPDARCYECPLFNAHFIPSTGRTDSKIAVVSRSPGYYEVKHNEHFAGPSGKILNHLLEQNGVKREDVFLTNTVLCESKAPPLAAIRACRGRLEREIGKADTIIAAGAEAAKAVVGVQSLSGSRGYVHKRTSYANNRTQRVVVTNNPAIVLKDDSTFPNLVRDFKLALNPLPAPTMPEVHWTNDIKEAKRWVQQIVNYPGLFCDIETRGLAHTASLASFGVSASGYKALAFGDRVVGNDDFVRDFLRPLLESKDVLYTWHNGKFDVRNLRSKGINARVDHDTLLLSYALDERSDEEQVHSLDYLLMNELNWPRYEPEEVRAWKSKVGRLERELRFDELEEVETPEALYEYNGLDAAGTALLYPILRDRGSSDNVLSYYQDILLRDANALIEMELRGFAYDIHKAADINENEVLPELARLKEEMRLILGDGNYNPNSSTQNAELVYDKWRLVHAIERGEEKERSVDKAVYTEIKEGRFFIAMGVPDSDKRTDPEGLDSFGEEAQSNGTQIDKAQIRDTAIRWAERLADFKALDKQRSTYIEGLIGRAETSGGRIYSDFKLHNAVTGRSTSSRPNLQNITRVKSGLPNIRSLFTASPGHTILSADYSQAELRAIAELSGDRRLGDIYKLGDSLHKRVAERFYGPDYTGEQYVNCKNMNFGVAYGQSAETFQEKHDVPVKEGKKFIDWWFKEFPEVKKWRQSIARQVLSEGHIQSALGHKRRFYLITHENKGSVIREAINFLPQHLAARFTLRAMTELIENGYPVVGEVHDSIILDVPDHALAHTAAVVRVTMESAAKQMLGWELPFTVEMHTGPSWGELESYDT